MYEEIIAEIERIVKEILYSDSPRYDASNDNSWRNAVNDIMDIIESLPKPPEDLQRAAGNYAHSLGYDEEKDRAEISGAKEDFLAGAEWQKEQMMKDAEWSEEDEKMYKSALWHISYSVSNGEKTDCNCLVTDWLKSIREKIVREDTK